MSAETLCAWPADRSDALNASTQPLIQLPRDATRTANSFIPPNPMLANFFHEGGSSWNKVNFHEIAPHIQFQSVESKANEQRQPRFEAKEDAFLRLRAIVDEYATDEAIKIHPRAVSTAGGFLHALPYGVALPEFSVEPDGSISMDWIAARTRVFSVSVGTGNRLACAWLDGTNEGHCVENFDGKEIPKRIIAGIMAITTNSYVTFRVA
jgi:hypothetical protein